MLMLGCKELRVKSSYTGGGNQNGHCLLVQTILLSSYFHCISLIISYIVLFILCNEPSIYLLQCYTSLIFQGVSGLARKFGLTPDQLGENLRDNYQRHETEQHPVEPDDAAENYLSRYVECCIYSRACRARSARSVAPCL